MVIAWVTCTQIFSFFVFVNRPILSLAVSIPSRSSMTNSRQAMATFSPHSNSSIRAAGSSWIPQKPSYGNNSFGNRMGALPAHA